MEDGTYVKLTKEQHSLQEITPGELNQPIDVAAVHTCKLLSPLFQFFSQILLGILSEYRAICVIQLLVR